MSNVLPISGHTAAATQTSAAGSFLSLTRRAAARAGQWRLLLLWWLALSLPALLVGLPLWRALSAQLDRSLMGPRLAGGLDMVVFFEAIIGLGDQGFAAGTLGLAGLVLTLLLSPWLTGMALTAARQSEPPTLGALLRGGLAEYGRLARMLIWGLLPLGAALGVGAGLMHWADARGAKAVLEASAEQAGQLALIASLVLYLLAQISVDAGRAQFVLQLRQRSAFKAWWRGLGALAPRAWRGVAAWLLVSLAGVVLVLLFSWLRLQWPGLIQQAFNLPAFVTWLGALLSAQVVVLAFAWMRCARLFALVEAGRNRG